MIGFALNVPIGTQAAWHPGPGLTDHASMTHPDKNGATNLTTA